MNHRWFNCMNCVSIPLIVLCASVGPVAAAELALKSQSEMWGDETMTRGVIKSLLPGAKDEKAVRAQLAGINDAFVRTGLLLAPDEIYFGEFAGYPACFIRGVSLANFSRRPYGITVVFAVEHTYAIHSFAPEGEKLPEPEKYLKIDGMPSQVTKAAFDFVAPRLPELIGEMRKAVLQLASLGEKKG